MARIDDCVYLECDRCGRSEYYHATHQAIIFGWELGARLPNEKPKDLCPNCYEKLSDFLQVFLYGDLDVKTDYGPIKRKEAPANEPDKSI